MLKASENKQTFILQNVWKQNIHKYIRVCVSCVVLSLAFAVTKGDNFSNATIVCSIWHILVCYKTAMHTISTNWPIDSPPKMASWRTSFVGPSFVFICQSCLCKSLSPSPSPIIAQWYYNRAIWLS